MVRPILKKFFQLVSGLLFFWYRRRKQNDNDDATLYRFFGYLNLELGKGLTMATIVSAGKSYRPMLEILAEREKTALTDAQLDARIKAIKAKIEEMKRKGK